MIIVMSILGVAFLFGAFVLPVLTRHMAGAASRRYELVTKFYELAPKLTADERIPRTFAELLQSISDDLDNPRVARGFFFAWLRGDVCERCERCERCEKCESSFNAQLETIPVDLREKLMAAVAIGIVGMTYASPLTGAVVRRLLFTPVGMPHRTSDAPRFAAALEERRICCAA